MTDGHTVEAENPDQNDEKDAHVIDESNEEDSAETESTEKANRAGRDGQGDKKDVKLEDLFADMDSDDEFPSSKDDAPASSSPEDPTSTE